MLQYLLDTDHLTLFEYAQPQLIKKLAAMPVGSFGISAITVEESLRGRLAAISKSKDGKTRVHRYARLVHSVKVLAHFPIADYDDDAENEFQRLLALRLKIGRQDLKIAAIALAQSLTLVTRNTKHFAQIPGLNLVDWSN